MNSIYRSDLFAGKRALITGGGTGIGLRIGRELAALGATVVVASRKAENVDAGVRAIEKQGGSALGFICNIREVESVTDLMGNIKKELRGLDFLVNNAGGQFPQHAEAISSKGWNAVLETNLTGTFQMCQAAFNTFFKDHGGAIVSVLANFWQGFPLMAHTGAARAGVANLTKTLCTEWGRYGLRINAVAPGVIQTTGLNTYDPAFKKLVDKAGLMNQTGRAGTEDEIASAVIFLLSPGASFINGATLSVDGGESLYHPFYPPHMPPPF